MSEYLNEGIELARLQAENQLAEYFERRDMPAPYAPPVHTIEPEKVLDVQTKRFIVCSGVVGGVILCAGAAKFAAAMYAPYVGGAFAICVVGVLLKGAFSGGKGSAPARSAAAPPSQNIIVNVNVSGSEANQNISK